MDDLSIDQKKLPGVKEVCRDFAVLEDHCLAHNLQEQEIENHLASNVHKSRLVQQDLRVAKRLQEEEDKRAKAQSRRQHKDLERIDNVMAQEMQEQLVWQAEQQRQQEERDEAIARKLQEREMKEERKRQKQLEANVEEPYYEDKAARNSVNKPRLARGIELPVSRPPSDVRAQDPGFDPPVSSSRERYRDLSQGRSPDHRSPKLDQLRRRDGPGSLYRYPEYYPAEASRSRAKEGTNADDTRGRHEGRGRRPEHYPSEVRTKYPEELLSERNRHVEAENTDRRRRKKAQLQDQEEPSDQDPVESAQDRVCREDPFERDKIVDKERDRAKRRDRDRERDGRRTRDEAPYRDEDRSQMRLLDEDSSWERNDHRHGSRDREPGRDRDRRGQKDPTREGGRDRDRDKHRSKDRGRGRELADPSLPAAGRGWLEEGPENAEYSGRQKLFSDLDDVSLEPHPRAQSGEPRSPGRLPRERGRIARGEYGMKEATQGLAHMDIRHQEFRDMEVARKLQEEEVQASQLDKRAAQVAQDEEIARRLMEEEKREYKRSREKEKQAQERQQRRAEGDVKPHEDIVRPRTREEYDHQRVRNAKPARPPPRAPNYENVDPGYIYSENYTPRPPSGPEAAYKGAYYRQ